MSSARPDCTSETPSVNPQRDFPSIARPPAGLAGYAATWRIRTNAGGDLAWDWRQGELPVRDLAPARRPAADAMSRHAPVHMACQTTGTVLVLESGLEHELARELDRDPSVAWIVAQPAMLRFEGEPGHVPDLLAEHEDGRVVVWDARPHEKRGAEFLRAAVLTEQACLAVGWEYALFDTAATARRLNLIWLANYRHRPGWPHHAAKCHLLERAVATVTIQELMELDEGDGQLIALLWHLLWTGELVVDLDEQITGTSLVGSSESNRD